MSSSSAHCAPPAAFPARWTEDALPEDGSRLMQIAALLGVTAELAQLGSASEEETLRARVVILERIAFARTAVDATVAELDCESEHARQLASYLARVETRSTTRFTVASIAVAAATGVASAFLTHADAPIQECVAIGGGALTAGLALVPLFERPRVAFWHSRNMLAEVWSGPLQASTFPDVVWAYLSRPGFSNLRAQAIRERIIARWHEYQAWHHDPQTSSLLFGIGGLYDAESLELRADMLNQVKAEVSLMNQDLVELAGALNV